MVNRARPADLRKALEVANLYVKMGINFVAVPFTSPEDGAALVNEAATRLDAIAREAEAATPATQQEADK